jgi:hypothetical protein
MTENVPDQVVDTPNPELRPQDSVVSFTTSQDSVYTYDEEGHTTRFKTATGEEQPTQDITVFADVRLRDAIALGPVALRYMRKRSASGVRIGVVETLPDGTDKAITDIAEVTDPDHLMVAVFRGDKVVKAKPASLMPRVGAYVYDSRRFEEEGAVETEGHVGHKVTGINYK